MGRPSRRMWPGSMRLSPPAKAQNRPITVYVARCSARGSGTVSVCWKLMVTGVRDGGKIQWMQATRTYLELTTPSRFRPAFGDFPDVTVMRVPPGEATPELYRRCYRTVGEAFHWRGPPALSHEHKPRPPADPGP